MLGPAACTASVCSWQVRGCERRPHMPLHTLKHAGQTWSAKGSAGATSFTVDLLLRRLCDHRARSLREIFKRLEQGIPESICLSGACSLSNSAGLTLAEHPTLAPHLQQRLIRKGSLLRRAAPGRRDGAKLDRGCPYACCSMPGRFCQPSGHLAPLASLARPGNHASVLAFMRWLPR